MADIKEKIHNIVNDPKVSFFIFPTPRLKELISADEHPHIKRLSTWVKTAMLKGDVLPLSKEDVLKFIEKTLPPHQQFFLSQSDIRVSGTPDIKINKETLQKE